MGEGMFIPFPIERKKTMVKNIKIKQIFVKYDGPKGEAMLTIDFYDPTHSRYRIPCPMGEWVRLTEDEYVHLKNKSMIHRNDHWRIMEREVEPAEDRIDKLEEKMEGTLKEKEQETEEEQDYPRKRGKKTNV